MNLVMTGNGKFIEIQGAGEEATFTDSQLQEMLALEKAGIEHLTRFQQKVLAAESLGE